MDEQTEQIESLPVKKKIGRPRKDVGPISADIRKAFVSHYLACFCVAEAVRRCGLRKSSKQIGYDLYHEPQVQFAIKHALNALRKKCEIKGADVILRLQRDEEETYAAKDYVQNIRCLELLGKVAAIFTEKVQVSQQVPLGPRVIVMNMPDGTQVEQKKEDFLAGRMGTN